MLSHTHTHKIKGKHKLDLVHKQLQHKTIVCSHGVALRQMHNHTYNMPFCLCMHLCRCIFHFLHEL